MTNFSFKSTLQTAVIGLLLSLFSLTASALETASAIKGLVADSNGEPLAGLTVVVKNEGTSFTRTVRTNESGQFLIRNLPVDNDYTVTVSGDGYSSKAFNDVALTLGETTSLNFNLTTTGVIEELVVTGARLKTQVAVGPSAAFGLDVLERAPAINRNITDVIRIDPRIYVDESRGDINAVQCGGKNSRFNSLTVDGVKTNDSFGLNSNGYPTERMPFSYDAINQVAVELAPFDARYGGFTACNINAVTKSGSNEFFGSVFYDYTDDDMRADKLEGDDISTGSYDEKRWGVTLGGPIIQDTLFFFAAYEKLDGANLFDRGPIGSGAVNEVNVSQAELDEITSIAQTLYQYDPGGIPSSMDHEDEKLLVKLDWYITDRHRLAFTYNYNDGENFTESDGDLDEFEFANHLYERGAELKSYAGTFYSDWTDNFSTEVRYGYLDLDNRQISVGGNDFGEIRVELDDVDVYLGGDDSRQSNKLSYDVHSYSFRGNYQFNDHSLSFGIEREELEVFNLFVQHSETEIRFRGIDNFRDGLASAIYYNNAPSQNPSDAAADWGYEMTTVFVQDEFELAPDLVIVAGLRYDRYTSDDSPVVNPDFVAEYGFGNDATIDGEGLLQPRLAFTYYLSDEMTLRGGVGLYSGGNPNVWLSNNYSNNNVLQFGQRGRSFGYTDGSRSLFDSDVEYRAVEDGVPSGPGYGIPSEIYDAVSAGVGDNFEINYLDPGFDLPSEWKFALGLTYEFENDMTLQADVLWTKGEDTAIVLHGDLEYVGQTAEGYPQYDSVRAPSFILTNSDEGNQSFGASLFLTKYFNNGMDFSLGYAYTDAEDVQPMTSSVAFSNYTSRAFFDPQEDEQSTSNYNIEHRFTATYNWRAEWFGSDNPTILSFFGTLRQGPSYSDTFDGTINPYGFTPYLDFQEIVLRPGDNRNDNDGHWWGKIDMKVEQQFKVGPGQAAAFLIVDNLSNLLNDDWGVLEQVNFPNTVGPGDEAQPRVGDASRYEIRVGLKYDF